MRLGHEPPRGFTLIELLVVVSIVALLVSILLPSLARARRQAKCVQCQSNVRQLMTAMQHHASENRGIYMPFEDASADSLQPLFPKYLSNVRIAVCPSTRNVVKRRIIQGSRGALLPVLPAFDLSEPARDAQDSTGGHSYETHGWFCGPCIYPDGRVIDGVARHEQMARLAGIQPRSYPYGHLLKTQQTVKEPSNAFIVADADVKPIGPGNEHDNYPDPLNNHGVHGVNIGFLDLHVAWVRPDWLGRTYRAGNQGDHFATGNHVITGRPLDPGLVVTEVQRNGRTFTLFSYE